MKHHLKTPHGALRTNADALSSEAMRHERIFGAAGLYGRLVQHNALMHREAISAGTSVVRAWLARRNGTGPIQALDLACGSAPITIAALMHHGQVRFLLETFEGVLVVGVRCASNDSFSSFRN